MGHPPIGTAASCYIRKSANPTDTAARRVASTSFRRSAGITGRGPQPCRRSCRPALRRAARLCRCSRHSQHFDAFDS